MPGQQLRQPVGLAVELAVGDGLAEVGRGDHVRGRRGPSLERVMDVRMGDRPARALPESLEETAVLS
ncbi:hypothetical protein GCM10023074_24580 [Microbispora amethystogenes]|uniref:Uncharacterized protein n=1 Tax=Microbispora amethystogenes TaxID=1427754 RepID=A0ABQ4F8K2_9ACTN|nr:hypothetical protein Mam01_13210 [Microbispora amethystogenes]